MFGLSLSKIALYVGIAVALCGVVYGGLVHYDRVIAERATFKDERDAARQALAFAEEENHNLREDAVRLGKLLTKRERERNVAQKEKDALNAQIAELKDHTDPQVRAWARARVPAAAADIVCKFIVCADADQNGAGQGAGKPDGAHTGAGLGAIPNKFGLTPITGGVRLRPKAMQSRQIVRL